MSFLSRFNRGLQGNVKLGMINIHVTLTPFRYESRITKEVVTLKNKGVFKSILIFALHEKGLPTNQKLIDGVEVRRLRLSSRLLPRTLLFQPIKYLELVLIIIFSLSKLKISSVNIHSVSLLPLGILLKQIHKCSLIYDAHELETEISSSGAVRKNMAKIIERFCIKACDLTIVVSEGIADWYEREHEIPRPTVVLNAPPARDLQKKNFFREKLKIREDQKILLYQGGLSAGRGVSLLLSAFQRRRDDRIVVVFMGYGELEAEIRALASRFPNIFYFPAVAPDAVLEFTSSADIGVSLIQNTCLSYEYCMPNKLFEYAMVGLPVVVSSMKDMSQFVTQHNMGVVVKELNPASINHAINQLLSGDLMIMSKKAYQAAIDNAWEVQAKKMLAAYEKIGFFSSDSSGAAQQNEFV